MNKIYKILRVVIGLKAVMGITYINNLIETMGTHLENLKGGLEFYSIFRFTDTFLVLTISIFLIIGLVLQLFQKKMRLNIWLKLSIMFYTSYFIIVSLPTFFLMDYTDFITRMNTLEKLRFFTNTFTIVLLITAYLIFLNQSFKDKNYKIIEDVSNKRNIRFLNYILDLLMIAYLSFWSSKYEYFQNWEYPFVFAIIAFGYYFSLEVLFRQTFGKVVTNTYVSSAKYTFVWAIFLRTLCRRIPFEPLSFFGFGRWHDTLSKTKVVLIEMTQTDKNL